MSTSHQQEEADRIYGLGMEIEACLNLGSLRALRSKDSRTRLSTYLAVRKTLEVMSDRVNQILDKLPVILTMQWRIEDALTITSVRTDCGEGFTPEALEYLVRHFQERLAKASSDPTTEEDLVDQIKELGALVVKQLSISRFSPEMHYVVAEYFHYLVKNEAQAIQHYDSAMSEYSEDPRPFIAAGEIHLKNEDYDLALGCFERANELSRWDANCLLWLARTYVGLGDIDVARTWYDQYVHELQDDPRKIIPFLYVSKIVASRQDLVLLEDRIFGEIETLRFDPDIGEMSQNAQTYIDHELQQLAWRMETEDKRAIASKSANYHHLVLESIELMEYSIFTLWDLSHLEDYLHAINTWLSEHDEDEPWGYLAHRHPKTLSAHAIRMAKESPQDVVDDPLLLRCYYLLDHLRDVADLDHLEIMRDFAASLDVSDEWGLYEEVSLALQHSQSVNTQYLKIGWDLFVESMSIQAARADRAIGGVLRRSWQYALRSDITGTQFQELLTTIRAQPKLGIFLVTDLLLANRHLEGEMITRLVKTLPRVEIPKVAVSRLSRAIAHSGYSELAISYTVEHGPEYLQHPDVLGAIVEHIIECSSGRRIQLLSYLYEKAQADHNTDIDDIVERSLSGEADHSTLPYVRDKWLLIRGRLQAMHGEVSEAKKTFELLTATDNPIGSLELITEFISDDQERLRQYISLFWRLSKQRDPYFRILMNILETAVILGDFTTFAVYAAIAEHDGYDIDGLRSSILLRGGMDGCFLAISELLTKGRFYLGSQEEKYLREYIKRSKSLRPNANNPLLKHRLLASWSECIMEEDNKYRLMESHWKDLAMIEFDPNDPQSVQSFTDSMAEAFALEFSSEDSTEVDALNAFCNHIDLHARDTYHEFARIFDGLGDIESRVACRAAWGGFIDHFLSIASKFEYTYEWRETWQELRNHLPFPSHPEITITHEWSGIGLPN